MNKWLIGASVFVLAGATAAGCTTSEEDDGTGLGGSSVTGGTAGETSTGGASGGTTTGGGAGEAATGGVTGGGVPGGGAGGEVTGGGEGGAATGGAATGGAATGGATTGGAATGGAATGGATTGGAGGAGGAGGEGGGVPACVGGDVPGSLPGQTCTQWALAQFATTTCPSATGQPTALDFCEYYEQYGRAEVFTDLIACFAEYPLVELDCSAAHDQFMWDCVDSVGANACATSDATTVCAGVASDCGGVTTDYCEQQLNLVIGAERGVISDCWDAVDKTGTDWADVCADEFETCILGSS